MSLYDDLIKIYPELADSQEFGINGSIRLQDDSDGAGNYIAKWEYDKPIPKGFKLGK